MLLFGKVSLAVFSCLQLQSLYFMSFGVGEESRGCILANSSNPSHYPTDPTSKVLSRISDHLMCLKMSSCVIMYTVIHTFAINPKYSSRFRAIFQGRSLSGNLHTCFLHMNRTGHQVSSEVLPVRCIQPPLFPRSLIPFHCPTKHRSQTLTRPGSRTSH